MRGIVPASIVACVCFVFSAAAPAQEVVGTFADAEGGGLWRLRLDHAAGAPGSIEVLARSPEWRTLRKLALRVDADGRRMVAATAPVKSRSNILLVDLDPVVHPPRHSDASPPTAQWGDTPTTISRSFPAEADEIAATPTGFLIGGDDGFIQEVVTDPFLARHRCQSEPPCIETWSLRTLLQPGGSRAEDIRVRPDGQSAWVTLQRDSRKDGHHGHRLVRIGLPDIRVLGDIHLPRDLREHHPPDSPRDHGPSPEIVLEHVATNTLLVTLDNYGAVLLADLDAALEGRLADEVRISTALDGSYGSAYPDRMIVLDLPGGAVALVANAGPSGGAVVIDLQRRRRIATIECRPGLEALTPSGDGSIVVAAAAGKIKERTDRGATRRLEPAPEVVLIDLAEPASPQLSVVPRPGQVLWVAATGVPDLVALVERHSDRERDDLTILRVTRGVDGAPAAEVVATLEGPGRLDRVIAVPSRPAAPPAVAAPAPSPAERERAVSRETPDP